MDYDAHKELSQTVRSVPNTATLWALKEARDRASQKARRRILRLLGVLVVVLFLWAYNRALETF